MAKGKSSNSLKLAIIIGALIGAAIIGYLLWKRSVKAKGVYGVGSPETLPSDVNINNLDPDILTNPDSVQADPEFDWIINPAVAKYLTNRLPENRREELKTQVSSIATQKKNNPSAYPDSNGLRGQLSDIGHALYQMKFWSGDILDSLLLAQ